MICRVVLAFLRQLASGLLALSNPFAFEPNMAFRLFLALPPPPSSGGSAQEAARNLADSFDAQRALRSAVVLLPCGVSRHTALAGAHLRPADSTRLFRAFLVTESTRALGCKTRRPRGADFLAG